MWFLAICVRPLDLRVSYIADLEANEQQVLPRHFVQVVTCHVALRHGMIAWNGIVLFGKKYNNT